MIYFLFFYSIIKLYVILTLYQQAHYNLKEYAKYFSRNILLYDFIPFLSVVLGLYTQEIGVIILSGIYILLYALFYLFLKVKLVFSKRIIRLTLFTFLYLGVLYFIPYINSYLLLFLEFSILPLLFLEIKISNLLNQKYLKQAKRKINTYKGTKIMITGSYGKTSTKQLFNQILNVYDNSIATPKSYNTPLGISRFINESHIDLYNYLILEYGASKNKDIVDLCRFATPDIAVVTEIGYMHINGFKTIENIVKEKMSLLKNCQLAILNYDNPYIRNYKIECPSLTYGFDFGDYNARNINEGSFDFYYKNEFIIHYDTSLIGKHQILNLLAALSYIHYKEYDLEKLTKVLPLLKQEDNRLQIKKYNNRIVLDDSFNSNYKGFVAALKTLNKYEGKKILITPGIVELGKYEKKIYRALAEHIVVNTDIIILVGYFETKVLYEALAKYNKELYVVHSFKEGYELYLKLITKAKASAVLIENDLPDIYKRGLVF